MIVGYARTSTIDQVAGFEAQQRDLVAAGCTKLFKEQLSSVDAKRAKLDAALEFVREGDTFVVTKIDRLARSVMDLTRIVDQLDRKKVTLKILAIGLDTSTPTGRLTLNLLGSIAQFEREVMLERQREGIARAKAEGKYKGRPVTFDPAEVRRLKAEGLGASAIAQKLGCARSTVYEALQGH